MPSNTLSPLPPMELATGFWSFKALASAALMSLKMLVEYSDWLTEVDFVHPHVVPLDAPGVNGLVTARKPCVSRPFLPSPPRPGPSR